MGMNNPPHPGEFICEIYSKPFDLSYCKIAEKLKVSASTLNQLINGNSNITPRWRLGCQNRRAFPESWLTMQDRYDLWHATKKVNLRNVEKVGRSVA